MIALGKSSLIFATMNRTGKQLSQKLVLALCLVLATLAHAVPPKEIINNLGSDDFSVREIAHAKLKDWANNNRQKAPEKIFSIWKKNKDPEVKSRLFTLLKEAVITRKFGLGRGYLGISMESRVRGNGLGMQADEGGVLVAKVFPDTPAEKIGIKPGDIIIKLDDIDLVKLPKKFRNREPQQVLIDHIKSKNAGDMVRLVVSRGKKTMKMKATLKKLEGNPRFFNQRNFDLKNKERQKYFKNWMEKMNKE